MLITFATISTGTEINYLVYNFNLSLLFLFKDRHSFYLFLDFQNVILD